MKELEEVIIEGEEFCVVPEEAFQFLPEEWREHFQSTAANGRAVLKSVDPELSRLSRLSNSFATLVTLKHIRDRLAAYQFSPDLESVLELEMMTTAFAVTYARLFNGGRASGFSRSDLPAKLRSAHDEILDLRNKRFAHNDDHPSIENAMHIDFDQPRFSVRFALQLGLYVGGAKPWHELVDYLDEAVLTRLEKLMARLKTRTGHNWVFATSPETA